MNPSKLLPFGAIIAILSAVACGSGPTTPAVTPSSSPVAANASTGAAASPAPSFEPNASDHDAPPQAASATATAAELPPHDPTQLDPALATARAPDVFRARFVTTRGAFVVEVHRDWAPNGADRFYNLVKMGFFDDTRFFRVIEGFMVQFGLSGDPRVSSKWRTANVKDDPVAKSNKRGMVTFAQTSAPDSRTTQVFINFADNAALDASRFAPFGEVVQGMNVVDALYGGYGEGRPSGSGPDQARIQEDGNQYLDADFPKLDRITMAQVL